MSTDEPASPWLPGTLAVRLDRTKPDVDVRAKNLGVGWTEQHSLSQVGQSGSGGADRMAVAAATGWISQSSTQTSSSSKTTADGLVENSCHWVDFTTDTGIAPQPATILSWSPLATK